MEANIIGLEQRIETLISECRRLNTENRSLKSEQGDLLAEKTQLKEKNRLACTRLEKIGRSITERRSINKIVMFAGNR